MKITLSWLALIVLGLNVFGSSRSAQASLTGGPVPFEKNSVLTGKVLSSGRCDETSDHRPPEVWVSIGQILLYQVEVPVNGSYEFHLVPGKYDLLVTSSNGCLDQTQVTLEPKQVAKVELRLAASRTPAGGSK